MVNVALAMCAVVAVVFSTVCWFGLVQPWLRQSASLHWPRVPARLDRIDSRLSGSSSGGQHLVGSFTYTVDGQTRRSDRISWYDGDRLPPGASTHLAAVDPADPDQAVLMPELGPGMLRATGLGAASVLSLAGTILWLLVRCDRLAIRTTYGPGPRLRYSQM
jgi:hypothetical protein